MAAGGVAQVAGGVPAMCDGITQGRAGMELSLFSRDVIAMATAVALAHDMFDGALLLGVCDKIVPGLLIGALAFGHLPAVLVPAGPMPSGLSNGEKSRVRQLHAEGRASARGAARRRVGRLPRARHLHLLRHRQLQPAARGGDGAAAAGLRLRQPGHAAAPGADARGRPARRRADGARRRRLHAARASWSTSARSSTRSSRCWPRGGSTNHTLHLVAIAAAAGIRLDVGGLRRALRRTSRCWRASTRTARADVNHFHAAGGTALLFAELLDAGLLHGDVRTVDGRRPRRVHARARAGRGRAARVARAATSPRADPGVLRGVADPFSADGGLRVLAASLGHAVVKVSAVAPEHRVVTAPARVFDDQATCSRRSTPASSTARTSSR